MKNRRNNKGVKVSQTRPFEGLVKQLKRESLVLVTFTDVKAFAKECFDRGIKVGVGDVYEDKGIIIYKD